MHPPANVSKQQQQQHHHLLLLLPPAKSNHLPAKPCMRTRGFTVTEGVELTSVGVDAERCCADLFLTRPQSPPKKQKSSAALRTQPPTNYLGSHAYAGYLPCLPGSSMSLPSSTSVLGPQSTVQIKCIQRTVSSHSYHHRAHRDSGRESSLDP